MMMEKPDEADDRGREGMIAKDEAGVSEDVVMVIVMVGGAVGDDWGCCVGCQGALGM